MEFVRCQLSLSIVKCNKSITHPDYRQTHDIYLSLLRGLEHYCKIENEIKLSEIFSTHLSRSHNIPCFQSSFNFLTSFTGSVRLLSRSLDPNSRFYTPLSSTHIPDSDADTYHAHLINTLYSVYPCFSSSRRGKLRERPERARQLGEIGIFTFVPTNGSR